MKEDNYIIDKLKEVVHSVDSNSKLIIFGSIAKGDYNKDSDQDFLVLTSKNIQQVFKRVIIDKITEVEISEIIRVQLMLRKMVDWNEWNNVTQVYKNIKKDCIWL